MNARSEEVRALIARQAADWFVVHRDGNLGPRARQDFDEWLLASPVHVEEYLGVTALALALPTAADDPESPLDALLERAQLESGRVVVPLDSHSSSRVASITSYFAAGSSRRWLRSWLPSGPPSSFGARYFETAAPVAASAPMTIRSDHGRTGNKETVRCIRAVT